MRPSSASRPQRSRRRLWEATRKGLPEGALPYIDDPTARFGVVSGHQRRTELLEGEQLTHSHGGELVEGARCHLFKEALQADPEASKLPWADVKELYLTGRIKVFLSPLQAFRGLAEEIEGSWQEAVRALGVPQERLLWTVDRRGHGSQLEFNEAGGYAAVVIWLP